MVWSIRPKSAWICWKNCFLLIFTWQISASKNIYHYGGIDHGTFGHFQVIDLEVFQNSACGYQLRIIGGKILSKRSETCLKALWKRILDFAKIGYNCVDYKASGWRRLCQWEGRRPPLLSQGLNISKMHILGRHQFPTTWFKNNLRLLLSIAQSSTLIEPCK